MKKNVSNGKIKWDKWDKSKNVEHFAVSYLTAIVIQYEEVNAVLSKMFVNTASNFYNGTTLVLGYI